MCPVSIAGSSPRARGTARDRSARPDRHRFIPACAGNSAPAAGPAGRSPVHPRVRGEQAVCTVKKGTLVGSSPRARGTAVGADGAVVESRFIPACAGNSHMALAIISFGTVHPRVRGEQYRLRVGNYRVFGSSPRARGTGGTRRRCACRTRFIPACAGNSQPAGQLLRGVAVHPRVRGEQWDGVLYKGAYGGSSPRARGTDPD